MGILSPLLTELTVVYIVYSLTTTTMDKLSNPVDMLKLTVSEQTQKIKSVEGKLWGTLQRLADTEANIHLLSTLRSLGLSTNDVRNFIEKQSIHKKANKSLDVKLKKHAMRSKLVDACAFAKQLRQTKNIQKNQVLKKYQHSKARGRKVVRELMVKYQTYKTSQMATADKKIKLYKSRNELKRLDTKVKIISFKTPALCCRLD